MSSAPDDLNLRARQSERPRTLNAHLVAERDDVVVKQNRETNDADRVRHKKVYAPPIVSIALCALDLHVQYTIFAASAGSVGVGAYSGQSASGGAFMASGGECG